MIGETPSVMPGVFFVLQRKNNAVFFLGSVNIKTSQASVQGRA
jgi:hypothetical protein